jgi:predicted nucleotidyltransferase
MGRDKKQSGRELPEAITPLLEPLAALQRVLEHYGNRGVIIGGIAASLLGRPRLTADLDAVILISIDELPGLFVVTRNEGLIPRISDAETFARQHRVLLLQHDSSKINVDLSLGILPFETEMVDRGEIFSVGGIQVRLPTPEDLIILKAIAHRPKDLSDISSIADVHPNIDKERIRFWVQQFGEVLNNPGIWNDIEHLL